MTKFSQKISKGDFGKKLEFRSQDEMGQLALSLNQMSEDLENKIKVISEDRNKMEVVLSSIIEGIAAIDREGIGSDKSDPYLPPKTTNYKLTKS